MFGVAWALDSSQWSLTFEVRKRLAIPPAIAATMGELSQWSLTFEVRKSVTGHPTPPPAERRNGA